MTDNVARASEALANNLNPFDIRRLSDELIFYRYRLRVINSEYQILMWVYTRRLAVERELN